MLNKYSTVERYAERNYNYDAWGNCSGPLNSLGNVITYDGHIGNFNPLRYRGYYYDTESGLYYLGSRYYDPKMFRFVNADSAGLLTSSPMSLGNKNLFTYGNNNPVMLKDVNGRIAVTATVLLVAGAGGTGINISFWCSFSLYRRYILGRSC